MPVRRLALLLVLPALAATAPAAAAQAPPGFTDGARTAGDPLVPVTGNGGYDVSAYRLDLTAGPRARRLAGTAEVDATATQDLRTFALDLSNRMRVSAVRIGGVSAGFAQRRRKLVVAPSGGLAQGTAFTVAVDYAGRPRPAASAFTGATGWLPTRDGAAVASEPTGSWTWFPCNDRPDDKATFAVRLTVPEGLSVVSGGVLEAHTGTTWSWVQDRPVAPYLDSVTVGRLRVLQGTSPGGVALYSAVERSSETRMRRFRDRIRRKARRALALTGATVDRLAARLGPFPFAASGGVAVDLPLGFALETASRPTYFGILDPEVQAHELAHQWFGDIVTVRSWRDIWLHEGVATWVSWWAEHERDPRKPTSARRAAAVLRSPLRVRGRRSPLWRPVIPRRSRDLFGPAVYERGGATLEALRQKIGDAAFTTLLRTFVDEHRYGSVTTADFTALAERVSGQRLGGFFREWLLRDGRPRTDRPSARFRR